MPLILPKYFQSARQRVWTERRTVTWAGLALLSRLAPLSAVPIMLHFSTIGDADEYALILSNAGIISIAMNFGQLSNMQSRFTGSGFSSIAIQGFLTAALFSILIFIAFYLVSRDINYTLLNVFFSFSMAMASQYSILLRCSREFSRAILSEILRISIFSLLIFSAIFYKYLNYIVISCIIIMYYMIPYIVMILNVRVSSAEFRSAVGESWSDKSRLFYWALSAFLSGGAWVVIRYGVAIFGDKGDLAKFSAIMSICSAGVILTDILYTRMSRTIIAHTESGHSAQFYSLAKIMLMLAVLGFIFLAVLSISYVYVALDAVQDLVALSLLLSLGYLLRFFYVFGQNVLIAKGVATYDMFGGVAMMVVALATSFLLVPFLGVVGAGIAFLSTAGVMLIVIGWGVRRHWGRV